MKTVILRNGGEVPEQIVKTMFMTLEELKRDDPAALREAVRFARDPSRVPPGRTGAVLAGVGLTLDGRMAQATRDVIQSAAEGDGAGLRLVSPYRPEARDD